MLSTADRFGILVGVDGSLACDVAVRWAAQEGRMRGMPITLVHVITPEPTPTQVSLGAPIIADPCCPAIVGEEPLQVAGGIASVDSTFGSLTPQQDRMGRPC
jgi:nucleotide-binding universal stress UspA family protein